MSITEKDREFLRMACRLAYDNIDNDGGPFGAVIVKDGEVVATGVNTVTVTTDPTAHAEVNAIRSACKKTGDFKLQGCVVYSSCEPCPMCLSALYWAGVSKIYFGNTKTDAKNIDFDDSFIYDEIDKSPEMRFIPCVRIDEPEAIKAFEKWQSKPDKVEY